MLTDNLIRDFITRTVRKSRDEILECIDFESVFEDIVTLMEQAREAGFDKEEKKDLPRQKCIEIFINENFSEFLIRKIKNEWNDELAIFYE